MSASTPSEKATLFNNYFFSVFTQPRVRASLPTVSIHHHDLLGTAIIQVDEVLKILKKLDVSTFQRLLVRMDCHLECLKNVAIKLHLLYFISLMYL